MRTAACIRSQPFSAVLITPKVIRWHSTSGLPGTSRRVGGFGTSVFSEFTLMCNEHKAVNLGQGFPDWEAPDFVKAAGQRAIAQNFNQYTRSQGHLSLVNTLASMYSPQMARKIDAMTEVVVTSGATEGGFATMQALVDEGDEVIMMEPFYDAYPAWVTMAGGVPRFVPLRAPVGCRMSSQFTLDMRELESAITKRTKILMLNTPHNPLGKVFNRTELTAIAQLVQKHNLICVSDEVYDQLVYDKVEHISIASLPGMWDRTVTLGSGGKTFSTTGWKVGWAIGPKRLCDGIFKAHQWIPFCVTTPMQEATTIALQEAQKNGFLSGLAARFEGSRKRLYDGLESAGLKPILPQGGYFVMADTSSLNVPVAKGERRDFEVARWLIRNIGVGPIPPSAFYTPEHAPLAANMARFAFCKQDANIDEACRRLQKLKSSTTGIKK